MSKAPETRIRRHADGSIDSDHYQAIGRLRRAEQARMFAAGITRWPGLCRLFQSFAASNRRPDRTATAAAETNSSMTS